MLALVYTMAIKPTLDGRPEKQKLSLFVPVPFDAPTETIPLLLDISDVKIYFWVRARGKTTPADGGVIVVYKGEKIYWPSSKTFQIAGERYPPQAISVHVD